MRRMILVIALLLSPETARAFCGFYEGGPW